MRCLLTLTGLLSGMLIGTSCSRGRFEPSPAPQPYPYLSGAFTGEEVPESPDPLVSYRWPDPKASDGLEIYTLKPVRVSTDQSASFRNLPSLSSRSADVLVEGTGSIMMDFGQVNAAWLEFDSEDLSGVVEMSISEYNEPAIVNTGAQHRIKTLAPVRYGNTWRLELNDELYEGVRYGWIHVRSVDRPWHIRQARLVCQIKPTNYNGSFSCSDPLLTRIWYTGAYGVKLNLLKDFFGAILMERSDRFSWTGDAYTSQAASLVAFGNDDFILTNIDHTAEQNNGILSYSLYWIQSLADYYQYTGDAATVEKYLDNACGKLDEAYRYYGTDPELRFYGWDERLGAGFEDPSSHEPQQAYKMLSIKSWLDFARIMEQCGRDELAVKYRQYADEKMAALRQDEDWYRDFGLHAAADAINAGFTSSSEQAALYRNEFSNRVNRLSFSPFNQYFIIQAMARMNKHDAAIAAIRDCWGGQINYGATTFFEVYRPSWNRVLGYNDAPPNGQCGYTSLAHPWGGGVTQWLTEEVLGIRPAGPGFTTCKITPHLGRTLTSVKGSVPTPHGTISAAFDVASGRCSFTLPEGTSGLVGIPKVERRIVSISLGNRTLWDGTFRPVPGIQDAWEDDDFVYLLVGEPGTCQLQVMYSGDTPEYVELPWIYPASFVKEDSITAGNWGGVYGGDGYVLFSCQPAHGDTTDLQVLPSYVDRVVCRKHMSALLAEGVDDQRAPSPGPGNTFPRCAGAILTQDPKATLQTMTVDICLNKDMPYRVALYFLDWENSGRRSGIEMFDLESRELIAPVQIVRDYHQGRYMVYRYDRSARFRVNHVRGPNASVSGLFFDRNF
jgi:alpha-L-rhamnosidase